MSAPAPLSLSMLRIAERCRRGDVLCHGAGLWWFEPGGDRCRQASARRAVRLGVVQPLAGDLFGDLCCAQTYGVTEGASS